MARMLNFPSNSGEDEEVREVFCHKQKRPRRAFLKKNLAYSEAAFLSVLS